MPLVAGAAEAAEARGAILARGEHEISPDFPTLSAARAASISVTRTFIRTAGYYTPGDRGGGVYVRVHSGHILSVGLFQSADGARWRLVNNGVLRAEQFGAKADYVSPTNRGTDNSGALQAAISFVGLFFNPDYAYYKSGPTIEFGYGSFYFSKSITPDRTIRLTGFGNGYGVGGQATNLVFAQNQHGIYLPAYKTKPSVSPGATGSVVDNLVLSSLGGATGHGLYAKTTITAHDVCIRDFPQRGVDIEADITISGNANGWRLSRLQISKCMAGGVYVGGGDVNAGLGDQIDVEQSKGPGIEDNSFLGNTWTACQVASTSGPAYKAMGLSSRSTFLGCYSESDCGASAIYQDNMVLGGLHAAGFTADTSGRIQIGRFETGFTTFNRHDDTVALGFSVRQSSNSLETWTAPAGDPIDVTWKSSCISFVNSGLDSRIYSMYTGVGNTNACGRASPVPPGFVIHPQGAFFGSPEGFLGQSRLLGFSSGPPASGQYARGDKIFDSAPTAGGAEGWVCVAGGSPGTWKPFGNIGS